MSDLRTGLAQRDLLDARSVLIPMRFLTFHCRACGCLQDSPRATLVPVGPVLLPMGWILNLCPAHGPETICFECAEEVR